MVGNDQVVFLNADGDKVQVIQLCCGIDTHARIGAAADDLGCHGGVGQLLPVVAVDGIYIYVFLLTQVVGEDPGAGALLTVDITNAFPGNVSKLLNVQRIALCNHHALLAAHAADQPHAALGEILLHKGNVVFAVFGVQQMAAGRMGFPTSNRHNTAHGAHMRGTHVHIVIFQMEEICQFIQQRIVAADDHQGIFQLVHRA